MTEMIAHMVDRFLAWRLPEDFSPDNGISFKPTHSEEFMSSQGKSPMRHEPTGTNLFTATQATAMVRHMVEGLSPADTGAVEAENVRLRAAIQWALGEGDSDFGDRIPQAGTSTRFWWRAELRARAALNHTEEGG